MGDIYVDDEGTVFNIIMMFDEDGIETSDPESARSILAQKPQDVRPAGVNQAFLRIRINGLKKVNPS